MTAGMAEERGVHPNSDFTQSKKPIQSQSPWMRLPMTIAVDPYCKFRNQEGLVSFARTVPPSYKARPVAKEQKILRTHFSAEDRGATVERPHWGENPRRFRNVGKDSALRWSGSSNNQVLGGYHTHKFSDLPFRQRQLSS